MTYEPWNKHTPGDPMPCQCRESVVEVRLHSGPEITGPARLWKWGKIEDSPYSEITDWRFVERKGEDVIADGPYTALEWDEDGTATVVLEKPSQPEWVRDDDQVRFTTTQFFDRADRWLISWDGAIAFQIKRRPVLTPAEPQLLAMLAVADDAEAAAIRRAARRAKIEVPD